MFNDQDFNTQFEKAWSGMEKQITKARRMIIVAWVAGFVALGGFMVFAGWVTCKILKYYGVI